MAASGKKAFILFHFEWYGHQVRMDRWDTTTMLTIALGIDNNEGDLGRGICTGKICGIM
jgi:hypothetical protein